ncbi:MAG: DUF1844 domain-containing protein [Candidatus Binatia bacterium]
MASDSDRQEEKGFKVEDRRRFSTESEEPRKDKEDATPPEGQNEQASVERAVEEGSEDKEALPAINFSTFIISLSTQALMHLGEIPNPLSGKAEKDISVVKQMIDIIGVLRDKTRGNLDQGEEKLMDHILFDLRMKYVEAVRKK